MQCYDMTFQGISGHHDVYIALVEWHPLQAVGVNGLTITQRPYSGCQYIGGPPHFILYLLISNLSCQQVILLLARCYSKMGIPCQNLLFHLSQFIEQNKGDTRSVTFVAHVYLRNNSIFNKGWSSN